MTSAFIISMKLVGVIFVVLQLHLLLFNYCGAAAAKQFGSGGCIAKERHALLKLKASLVLNETHLLSTWDNKSDCCSWKGIACSNKTGHVEMFNINGDEFGAFRGKINAPLMELRHLKYVNISYLNQYSSNFLELVGSLSNLRVLVFRGSFLSGRIHNSFARLSHLQYLDLSSNRLEGEIPHQFENISHLQHLDLSSNKLVGTIPHQLGRLSNLKHLDLGSNFHLVGSIPHEIGNISHLQHLDLSYNKLVGTIPRQFGKLSNLQELHLGSNDGLRVHDKNNHVGGEWLSNLTLLTHLDLSNVQNLNSSYVWLKIICKLPKIEELDLYMCHLKDLFLSQSTLNISIWDICTLQSLDVGYNYFNEDISTILPKLSGCARYSLQDLMLFGNQITGTFPDLSIFPNLKSINLFNNMLSGKVPDGDFPTKLESLNFGRNSLEGGIPKSFGNLCSLRSLDLSTNMLSEYLPVILHNLSVGCAKNSLKELDLSSNQIIGTIHDMSRFSSLETLYLDSNNLDGVITDSHFSNMTMLMYLNLSYNSLDLMFSENWVPPFQLDSISLRSCNLGPSFPKWLWSQEYLFDMDISNAGISDVVPVWFWTKATYTNFMNISYNNLTGTIPNLPITFSEGCQVIMDSNQLEGSIPPFFRSATLLQLSKNKFSEIRLLLCTNTTVDKLRVLDLSKNELSRQLPDCWNHLKSLKFLDLSSNTLSGEVPYTIGSLSKLRVLILRNNTFRGKLPVSMKNCREMIMLDLGDNRLSGPIPYWLGQKLQMLSLRRNRFSGSLPLSLCELTNIQLLDLSENNLSGPIFKCLKNFSAMSIIVSSERTMDTELFYPIGLRTGLGYEGYDLVALLMWKGAERLFKNNELILRSIDLSSNQLTGDIPEEIGNLIELVSLNLSSNNLTGEITSKIGKLTSLEFLDLSTNHLCCSIPPSLAQINRLSMLNLSNNNLSGRIPIGTQLQSFEASSYEGNVGLCGKPLDKTCPGDEEVAHQKPETPEESSPGDKKSIYLSVALGFITGLWGLWGSLLFIRTWRHKYVLFLNNIIDTIYVFMVLNATKFQRWLRG
ncbi:receptor-like protein EIX2 [Trifolium pratense]|uniref:receptor-like protein EIX2 n=1 Tax=Trifolium pratense TaxID=57577 RepID=UPI001E6982B1|nr:receptor-like protein EIX2 [Trifolium pratense]